MAPNNLLEAENLNKDRWDFFCLPVDWFNEEMKVNVPQLCLTLWNPMDY